MHLILVSSLLEQNSKIVYFFYVCSIRQEGPSPVCEAAIFEGVIVIIVIVIIVTEIKVPPYFVGFAQYHRLR